MDELTKILLVILGFLFAVSGQIIVQLNSERRKKSAVRDIIRVEIQAYIEACETAAIGPGTHEGAVDRARALLALLK